MIGEIKYKDISGPDGVPDGAYNVKVTNIVLADAAAGTYYLPDVGATILVHTYAKGDANGDGAVNVGDYVTTTNYILGMEPDPFIFTAADVDENRVIDVGDLVGIVNIVMDDFAMPQGGGEDENDGVSMSCTSRKEGDRVVVTLDLHNKMALTAWQMDVDMSDGLRLAQASLTSRASGHSLSVTDMPDGSVKMLGASPVNNLVEGSEGALLTLVFDGEIGDDDFVAFHGIKVAEADMTIHALSPITVGPGSSAVKEVTASARIYARGTDIIVETPIDTTVEFITPSGISRVMKANAGVNTYPADRGIIIVRVGSQVAKLKL